MGNAVRKSACCAPFFSDTSFRPCSVKKCTILQCHESSEKDEVKIAPPLNKPIVPPEMLLEILSWLSVRDLVKLQLVCKQWYALVHDRHFIERHMNQGPHRSFWNEIPSTRSTSERFPFVCGCDGLVLQKSNATHKYRIKNPTTCQILELPDPHKTKVAGMTFNFVQSTGEYKLVSVHDEKADKTGAFCEVLTVGKDSSWRSLKLNSLEHPGKIRERISVVSADSVVHCFQIWKIGSKFSLELVSLDLETECFIANTLRNELLGLGVWALNWCGKLAFAQLMKENLQVLVLEDYKKHRWSEWKTLVLPWAFMNKIGYQKSDLVPLFAESDTLWFWLKGKMVFSYNMRTGCTGQIYQSREGRKITNTFFQLKPSLVTFKGMKPGKQWLD